MRKSVLKTLGFVPVLLLTAAGCASGSNQAAASGASTAPHAHGLAVATTSLGKVLVENGRTLYMLSADSRNHSTCDASCLPFWPAVSGKQPAHAHGVTGTIGTTSVQTGGTTLTVSGQPLYTFVKDRRPGDVTGEGLKEFGGTWYAVSPAGRPIRSASSGSGGGGYARGGGGY
jgi:predicted lipoprotein with Yx(FWY)xxD motif